MIIKIAVGHFDDYHLKIFKDNVASAFSRRIIIFPKCILYRMPSMTAFYAKIDNASIRIHASIILEIFIYFSPK